MFSFNPINTFIVFSLFLMSNVHAGASFPRGCEASGFGYINNRLILNELGNQAYYLIQNRSDTKIALTRLNSEEAFMTPALHATLEPANWGAFASDIKNLNFKCYKTSGEIKTYVNCQDVLDVCQYPRVRFALSNMGNYWITFNKSQSSVIQDSVAKGIYLKW